MDARDAAAGKAEIVEIAQRAARDEDLSRAWDTMGPLKERWHGLGYAGAAEADLRAAYLQAWNDLRRRTDRAREEREAARHENLRRKRWVIDQIRIRIGSYDRSQAFSEVKALSAQFKDIGPVPRDHSDQVFAEYRNTLDDFHRWNRHEIAADIGRQIQRQRDMLDKQSADLHTAFERVREARSWKEPPAWAKDREARISRKFAAIEKREAWVGTLERRIDDTRRRIRELEARRAKYS